MGSHKVLFPKKNTGPSLGHQERHCAGSYEETFLSVEKSVLWNWVFRCLAQTEMRLIQRGLVQCRSWSCTTPCVWWWGAGKFCQALRLLTWRPAALQFLPSLLMSLEIYGNLFQPSWPN